MFAIKLSKEAVSKLSDEAFKEVMAVHLETEREKLEAERASAQRPRVVSSGKKA